jgi:hypothetical protein
MMAPPASGAFFEKKAPKKRLSPLEPGFCNTGSPEDKNFLRSFFLKKRPLPFANRIGPDKAVPSRGVRAILASRPNKRIHYHVYVRLQAGLA